MKKLVLFFVAMFLFLFSKSQDVILKKNGDEILAKIQEVTLTEVKYKKFDNIEGPTYVIPRAEIFMIKYENGTKEIFNSEPVTENKPGDNVLQSNTQEQATVIIYRKNSPVGMAVVYDVFANNVFVTKVKNNSYYVAKLNPGYTTFKAMTEPPEVLATMNLEPGKTYYLRCGIVTGVWIGRPTLEFVPESVGINDTAKMKKK